MAKFVISTLVISWITLQEIKPADQFAIGIIHDPDENYKDEISAVIQQIESTHSLQSNGLTLLTLSVSKDSNWTVCHLLDSKTIALVAAGSCHFQSYLSLTAESNLPVSLIRVEAGTSCGRVRHADPIFSSDSHFLWLPHVVGDTLAFLGTKELMIVYSGRFFQVSDAVAHYLSSLHVKTALMTVNQFIDPVLHYEANAHGSDINDTVPILLAVTRTEADLILSQHGDDTRYWLIFTGDTAMNISQSLQSVQFFIVPRFPSVTVSNAQFYSQKESMMIDRSVQLILTSFQKLRERSDFDSSHINTTCGHFNITVPSAASYLTDYLSQYVFDDRGELKTDHFDIVVSSAEGPQSTGHWNTSVGLTMPPKLVNDFSQQPLITNRTLIIGTEEAAPFMMLENNKTWKGFCVDMIEELAFRMGFKYEIRRSVDNLWGGINPDGSWNGLVGMAVRKEIDMAVGPISVTAERETAVDFTKPYMESAAGLLMRRFEDTTAKMFRTLMPFTLNVWMTLAGLVLLTGLLFGIVNKFSPADRDRPEVPNGDRWIDSMLDSAWVVYGSFMEQGAEKFPRSMSGRLMLGLWWLFTILTTASYTASLAAFLTFSMDDIPINSIYDLAQQSDILPLVKTGTNLYTLFQKGETTTYRRIYEMMQEAPEVTGSTDEMDLVISGPYALLTDREQLDLLQKDDCQSLVQGQEHFNNNGLGFFVQEGSALLEPLSNNMIKLMEAGLIDKWRRKWWSAKDVCSDEVARSTVQSLKLDTTAGPFILYAAAVVLALLILAAEKAINVLWPVCRAMLTGGPQEV